MSDLISKKELYRKLGEAYNKGYLTWGANEVIKDIIGECDSVEIKGDLISRQAVLDELEKWDWQDLYLPIHFKQILDDVPSVENKGEWIYLDECANSGYYCSICHKKLVKDGWSDTIKKINFCPNCGADMRGDT